MFDLSGTEKLLLRYKFQADEVVVWAEHLSSNKYLKRLGCLMWIISPMFFIFLTSLFDSLFLIFLFIVIFFIFWEFLPKHKDVVYIVTNFRAIVWHRKSPKGVRFISYYPDQFKHFEIQKNSDGTGNIVFYPESCCDERSGNKSGFVSIKDVNRIGELLERLVNNQVNRDSTESYFN